MRDRPGAPLGERLPGDPAQAGLAAHEGDPAATAAARAQGGRRRLVGDLPRSEHVTEEPGAFGRGRAQNRGVAISAGTGGSHNPRILADLAAAACPPVPVLLYHSVSTDPPRWIAPFAVTPQMFARHVQLIVESGRTALTVREYAVCLRDGRPLPPRPVLVTFDDGLADFHREVLPRLRAASLPATLFAVSGFVTKAAVVRPPGTWLDPPALRELHLEGIEIGAHTHSHPELDTLRLAAAAREVTHARDRLEDVLQQAVVSFAYPHGYFDARVQQLVRSAGYLGACAVRNAFSDAGDDPFAIARLTVRSTTSPARLAGWLDGTGAPSAPRAERARTRVWRTYRRSRAAVRRRGPVA